MGIIEQLLQWFTYVELWPGGKAANLFGVLWLIALTFVASRRFSWHFSELGWGKPSKLPKRALWIFAIILFGFLSTFLLQIITDEFISVPMGLVFGSWNLLAPHLGAFSLWKLIQFKWDSYLLILVYSSVFYVSGVWKFYHFTKESLIWLIVLLGFTFFLNSQGIIYFLNLSGWARIRNFWLSYPEWRIITGFLGASIIKKPGGSQ